jgi:hypothetical protein
MDYKELQEKVVREIEEARRAKEIEQQIVVELQAKAEPNKQIKSTLTIKF